MSLVQGGSSAIRTLARKGLLGDQSRELPLTSLRRVAPLSADVVSHDPVPNFTPNARPPYKPATHQASKQPTVSNSHPLRNTGLSSSLTSELFVKRIFSGSYSSLPSWPPNHPEPHPFHERRGHIEVRACRIVRREHPSAARYKSPSHQLRIPGAEGFSH
jgi:hypothetical protein